MYTTRLFLDARNKQKPAEFHPSQFDPLKLHDVIGRLVSEHKLHQRIYVPSPIGAKVVNYTNNVKGSIEWELIKFTQLEATNNESGGFTISRRREEKCTAQSLSNPERVRCEIIINVACPNWDAKFTLVKLCDISLVKATRDLFIQSINDIMKISQWTICDWIEFEFTTPTQPNHDLVHDMYFWLLGWMPGNEHNSWIRQVAEKIATNDIFLTPGNMQLSNKFYRLLPRAIEITSDSWKDIYAESSGSITVRKKIDGTRQLLVIDDGKVTTWSNGQLKSITMDTTKFGKSLYILDTEYLDRWYILHVLYAGDECYMQVGDEERLEIAHTLVTDDIQVCPTFISDKHGFKDSVIRANTDQKDACGLLITLGSQDPYWMQRVVKWNPPQEITIDFVLVKCPANLEGKIPYVKKHSTDTLHILMVSCHEKHAHVPPHLRIPSPVINCHKMIPFMPPQNREAHIFSHKDNLEGESCEMIWGAEGWRIKRISTKKSVLRGGAHMGNNVNIACDIFLKYFNPFRIEDLYAVSRTEKFPIPAGIIPEDLKAVILYRPSSALIPPKVKHILSIGPNALKGVARMEEPRGTKPDLPTHFIGGAMLVISFEIAPSGNKRWIKIMNAIVAPGGEIVHIAPGDVPDLGSDFKQTEDLPFRKWRRINDGNRLMTVEEVHAENEHTVGNPNAGFHYKFDRHKNKDIMALSSTLEYKQSFIIAPDRGETLCYIEFLCRFPPGTRIAMSDDVDKRIIGMFPHLKFGEPNPEVYIAHTWTKQELDDYNPRDVLLYFDPPQTEKFEIPKSYAVLIPYSEVGSNAVMLRSTNLKLKEKYTLTRSVWLQEMKYFHHTYRPSGFRHSTGGKPKGIDEMGFDHCFDCKSEISILQKYIKIMKGGDMVELIKSLD